MKGEYFLYKLTPGGMLVEPGTGGGGSFVIKPSDVMAAMSMAKLSIMERYLIESIIYPAVADESLRELLAEQGVFGLYREFLGYVSKTDISNGFYIHAAGLRSAQGWKLRKGEELLRTLCDIVVLETIFPGFVVCKRCGGTGEESHKKCTQCHGLRSSDEHLGAVRLIGSGKRYLSQENYARLLGVNRKVFTRSWKEKKEFLDLEIEAVKQAAARKIHWAVVNEGVEIATNQKGEVAASMCSSSEILKAKVKEQRKPKWSALKRSKLSMAKRGCDAVSSCGG